MWKTRLDMTSFSKWISFMIIGGIVAFVLSLDFISSEYLNYLYFESQGKISVWWKTLFFRGGFWAFGSTVAFVAYILSFIFARFRLRRFFKGGMPGRAGVALPVAAAVISLLIHGPALRTAWAYTVYFLNGQDMGILDPIYNKDVAFYMFRLQWYESMLGWLQVLLAFVTVYGLVPYVFAVKDIDFRREKSRYMEILKAGGVQLSISGGLFFLTLALEALLSGYSMLYDGGSSTVAGASYTDVHARKIAYTIFAYGGIILSIAIIVAGYMRKVVIPVAAAAIWVGFYVIVLGIFPGIMQSWIVDPNEFGKEKEYIDHSIHFTRLGYGIDDTDRRSFSAGGRVTKDALRAEGVLENIRLWDYRPIRDTFKQLQEIRLYYEFNDVDVDRYNVNGRMRQVMVSARELNSRELPDQAKSWIPGHLQYTHGYGVVVAPTNRVTEEGLPELWVKDFPPVKGPQGIPDVTKPGIYYGEMTDDYALVNTSMGEFDYPNAEGYAETTYDGDGGVLLGSGLRRLLVSWNFDTWEMLISKYISKDTRVLFNRQIHYAVRKIAPFLVYDPDPYIVMGDDGKLYWIMDAYTVSDNFPYSESFDFRFIQEFPGMGAEYGNFYNLHGINYIRNSVKVVIDAYTGKMTYYIVDHKDPIISAWSRFFPELFTDAKQMPGFIQKHLRYPETLFLVQAGMMRDYHMDDAQTFYNREDRWQISTEIYERSQQRVEPYYSVIKIPGEEKEDYVLMIPFIPNNKQNLVGWMAARCDYDFSKDRVADNQRLLLFEFPRTRQIYGTMQIESRIDQDPEISKELSLWNQQGSSVIRGNLLVIPVEDTLLYIEPIYLQSTKSPFPELRRVIAADSGGVVMEPTLDDAIGALLNRKGSNRSSEAERKTMTRGQFAQEALSIMRKLRSSAGSGKWKDFGEGMDALENIIEGMVGARD